MITLGKPQALLENPQVAESSFIRNYESDCRSLTEGATPIPDIVLWSKRQEVTADWRAIWWLWCELCFAAVVTATIPTQRATCRSLIACAKWTNCSSSATSSFCVRWLIAHQKPPVAPAEALWVIERPGRCAVSVWNSSLCRCTSGI